MLPASSHQDAGPCIPAEAGGCWGFGLSQAGQETPGPLPAAAAIRGGVSKPGVSVNVEDV